VELTLRGLADTRQAFDAVAAAYGRTNAENPILCAMRDRTLGLVTSHVRPGAWLLDLGCGPGLDAVWFGERGYRVTAIDWSPAMVQRARERVLQQGLASAVDVRPIGIHELPRLDDAQFDAAYSNFGPLNCVPDLGAVAVNLSARLRPGAVFVASVIGRVCPWEITRYGLTGDWPRVGARFSRDFVPVPLEGRTVWTRYYTPSAFERVFCVAGFRTLYLGGLGLFLPPPYLQGFYSRHPVLMRVLNRLERMAAHWPVLRQCGDHFLIAMTNERRT
jgi:SAM-dependent methyltransferase